MMVCTTARESYADGYFLAHKKLDVAVVASYGWPSDLNDDDILSPLLALNLERAGI